MFENFFTKKGNPQISSNFIFIIGTGRSGTHFIGRVIGNHPEVELLLEDTRNFNLVKKAAIRKMGSKHISRLFKRYKKIQHESNKRWILEKSHPNIWLVEDIVKEFPESIYFGMQRDVYQVVNSMLSHGGVKGVRSWYKNLPQDKENEFLGIHAGNISYFNSLPLEAKCTIRWLSHYYRLEELQRKFPQKIKVFNYEDFCVNFDDNLNYLNDKLSLDIDKFAEKPKLESLKKFENLDDAQLAIIEETLLRERDYFKDLYN